MTTDQTTKPTPALPPLVPGDQIHFHETIIFHLDGPNTTKGIPRSVDTRRGQTVTLTAGSLDGNPALLGLIDDPEGQTARWGKPMAGRGPFPADAPRYHPGTVEAELERDRRLADSWRIQDPQKRKSVQNSIYREFGRPGASVTIAEYAGDDGRFRDGTAVDERRRARWDGDR